jgi:hypothetical protein
MYCTSHRLFEEMPIAASGRSPGLNRGISIKIRPRHASAIDPEYGLRSEYRSIDGSE